MHHVKGEFDRDVTKLSLNYQVLMVQS